MAVDVTVDFKVCLRVFILTLVLEHLFDVELRIFGVEVPILVHRYLGIEIGVREGAAGPGARDTGSLGATRARRGPQLLAGGGRNRSGRGGVPIERLLGELLELLAAPGGEVGPSWAIGP